MKKTIILILFFCIKSQILFSQMTLNRDTSIKVKENNIELRGETYQKRKDKEAQVAEELRQGLRKSEIMDYEADDFFFLDEIEDC